jgi:anti-sigma regulatory factor (Ser/Thr protein kinase)
MHGLTAAPTICSTPKPDPGADIEGRPIGGLGVHIVRSMMDELEYRREGGRNILIMRKRLSGGTNSIDASRRPE